MSLPNLALLSRPSRLVFIGVGGIGSWLVEPVLRYFSGICNTALFVDGDHVENRNLARQSFNPSEVRSSKAECMRRRMLLMFPGHQLSAHVVFVRAANVMLIVKENDAVFLSPDNHAVRRVVSAHAQKLQNIVVFTAGNELYDGSCHVYVKAHGVALTKDFNQRHPEAVDGPAERVGCSELIDKGAIQLIAVNFMLAAMTMMAVQHVYSYGAFRTKDEFWSEVPQEVYGDIKALKMRSTLAGKPTKVNQQKLEEGVCSS